MRRSKLQVVVRLARFEETRRLRSLATAQGRYARVEGALEQIGAGIDGARLASAPATGQAVDAGTLAMSNEHLAGLQLHRAAAQHEHQQAHLAVNEALQSTVEARRKLRAIESAVARRDARERKLQRRRETRRIDEAARGRRPDEEPHDV
jgi:flagellar export protein FliJ